MVSVMEVPSSGLMASTTLITFICSGAELNLALISSAWINWKADNVLINLRAPGETGYKIPRGWLFDYVSCPNLLGELIEWAGFAILCWNLPALTFFIWTAANLVPRALSHHKWYRMQFAGYPAERKAVIPYLL